MYHLRSAFEEPDIQIDKAVLDSWRHDQLENAEASLTAAITTSQYPSHHVLASRALVQARLGKWDTALADAEWVCCSPFSHADAYMNSHPGPQSSAVGHRLRRKEYSACRQGRKVQGLSDLRHHIWTLSFVLCYLSPSRQGRFFRPSRPSIVQIL